MAAAHHRSDPPASLLPLGDAAWTVEFGDSIDAAVHARVLGFAAALERVRSVASPATGDEAGLWAAIVDVVPTFRSLTVHYDPLRCNGGALGAALLALAETSGSTTRVGRQWTIPVCFDADFAPDLDDLAKAKALSPEAIIALLCQATFQVYMIGFMPGFPYMGGLPAGLEMPRLSSPRKAVPARSLAIAGAMCAVYPWQSPGGWRLLGRTPVPMFSAAEAESPALLASGDRVRWQAIDRAAYGAIKAAVAAGTFARRSLLAPGGEA